MLDTVSGGCKRLFQKKEFFSSLYRCFHSDFERSGTHRVETHRSSISYFSCNNKKKSYFRTSNQYHHFQSIPVKLSVVHCTSQMRTMDNYRKKRASNTIVYKEQFRKYQTSKDGDPSIKESSRRSTSRRRRRSSRLRTKGNSPRSRLLIQSLLFSFNQLQSKRISKSILENEISKAEMKGLNKDNLEEVSKPLIVDGRFYNPWNTKAAMKEFDDIVHLLSDLRFIDKMSPRELQHLHKCMSMQTESSSTSLDSYNYHYNEIWKHYRLMLQGNIPEDGGVRITWIGHSTLYVQMGGFNFVTDPIWSERASPFQWAGPKRFIDPPYQIADLPPVDFILLSHNHYDHLDKDSILEFDRLAKIPKGHTFNTEKFTRLEDNYEGEEDGDDDDDGDENIEDGENESEQFDLNSIPKEDEYEMPALTYFVPIGMERLLRSFGVQGNIIEMNWWDGHKVSKLKRHRKRKNIHNLGANSASMDIDSALNNSDDYFHVNIISTPAQHWSSRFFFDRMTSLWCSFVISSDESNLHHISKHDLHLEDSVHTFSSQGITGENKNDKIRGSRFFFGGDTAYCPAFQEIGKAFGPFTCAALPIGAYEPKWFLKDQHIDPEDACQVHRDIKSKASIGIHWGTFPLAADDWHDAVDLLRESRTKKGIKEEDFVVLRPGESWLVKENIESDERDSVTRSERIPFLENDCHRYF